MLSPEDDGSLVLLDHLDHEEERHGERDHDEEQRADGHDERADARTLLANWKSLQNEGVMKIDEYIFFGGR